MPESIGFFVSRQTTVGKGRNTVHQRILTKMKGALLFSKFRLVGSIKRQELPEKSAISCLNKREAPAGTIFSSSFRG
jgi:hypothetical protein